jgi:hypothetical protein
MVVREIGHGLALNRGVCCHPFKGPKEPRPKERPSTNIARLEYDHASEPRPWLGTWDAVRLSCGHQERLLKDVFGVGFGWGKRGRKAPRQMGAGCGEVCEPNLRDRA